MTIKGTVMRNVLWVMLFQVVVGSHAGARAGESAKEVVASLTHDRYCLSTDDQSFCDQFQFEFRSRMRMEDQTLVVRRVLAERNDANSAILFASESGFPSGIFHDGSCILLWSDYPGKAKVLFGTNFVASFGVKSEGGIGYNFALTSSRQTRDSQFVFSLAGVLRRLTAGECRVEYCKPLRLVEIRRATGLVVRILLSHDTESGGFPIDRLSVSYPDQTGVCFSNFVIKQQPPRTLLIHSGKIEVGSPRFPAFTGNYDRRVWTPEIEYLGAVVDPSQPKFREGGEILLRSLRVYQDYDLKRSSREEFMNNLDKLSNEQDSVRADGMKGIIEFIDQEVVSRSVQKKKDRYRYCRQRAGAILEILIGPTAMEKLASEIKSMIRDRRGNLSLRCCAIDLCGMVDIWANWNTYDDFKEYLSESVEEGEVGAVLASARVRAHHGSNEDFQIVQKILSEERSGLYGRWTAVEVSGFTENSTSIVGHLKKLLNTKAPLEMRPVVKRVLRNLTADEEIRRTLASWYKQEEVVMRREVEEILALD